MNDQAKLGRLSTALTLMTEVVEDLQKAEAGDDAPLWLEAQDLANRIKEKANELRGRAEAS